MTLDDDTLEHKVFPRLAQQLRAAGEVHVDFDYATNFAHYLMRCEHDLWQRIEQELELTEDLQARFYLRDV